MADALAIVLTPKIIYEFNVRYYPIPDENGCFIWRGSFRDSRGYGRLFIKDNNLRRDYSAHRLSYMIHNHIQVLEDDAGLVLHRCPGGGNPSCVNPAHLYLGTSDDNVQDMFAAGRANPPKGENHPMTTLTDEDVIKIRLDYRFRKYDQAQLATMYGVNQSVISRIINRITWKHI